MKNVMNKLIFICGVLFYTFSSLKAQGTNEKVMLVMDLSTSMLAQDILPDRFQRSKDLACAFLDEYPNASIGITIFAGSWENVCMPVKDHKFLRSYLKEMKTGKLTDGTAIGSALLMAAHCLKEGGGTIILITDGMENCGTVSTSTAIEILKHYHIKLNVIGLGTNGVAPYPVEMLKGKVELIDMPTSIDHKYLSKITNATGGLYYGVSSIADYQKVIKDYQKPVWLEAPQGIKVSDDFHLTEKVIQWLINKTLGREDNLPFPK